ncbi:hypothetical protein K490DRAFT_62316 [Saccharata proteae CBS 121410]|uniref:Uncharacterized protein n=1 Tax=Saccharata proteae CBS 121410 TaxID=1314787 RepID=A0A9P4LXW1_9PEZI|nr:hypothetical protein K490DRAFT_62316 [Saccharata proteae CBS 121410]
MEDSAATLAPSVEESLMDGPILSPKDVLSTGRETPLDTSTELAPATQSSKEISRSPSPADSNYAPGWILKGEPSERDPTDIPLVALKLPDSKPVTLWAKLDTGADFNLIARATVEKLGRGFLLRPVTFGEHKIYEMGGNKWDMTHRILMSFQAGIKNREFENVEFWVPEQTEGLDSDNDKLPDVLLGWPLLREKSMVMVDLDYHNDPNPEYEVLAKRAWEEGDQEEKPRKRILITKNSPARPSPYAPRPRPR